MEIMDVLLWLKNNHSFLTSDVSQSIIPMMLIPLTAVTVVITSVAGIIASWFGLKLHTEGPRQFLEVLLKKRVLISIIIFNLVSFGVYKSYLYYKNLPSFLFTIQKKSDALNLPSTINYSDSPRRVHQYVDDSLLSKNIELTLIKEKKLPKGAFRSGTISGNSIFFGADDGFIYEVNLQSLELIRTFFIGTQVTTRPIIFKNRLYVGEGNHETHHARVYSFDLLTGKFINSFSTLGHTEGQPQIVEHDGRSYLLIVAGKDGIYAVDPINMKEIWHQVDGHIDATVNTVDGVVYAGSGSEKGTVRDQSFAVAYDLKTGKKIWKTELPISNWMHPLVTKKEVCFNLGEIYFPSTVGIFTCLDRFTGENLWSLPFNAPIASKPLLISTSNNDYAFIADFKGTACGIDLTKRTKMWCHKTGTEKTTYSLTSFEYDKENKILWYPGMKTGLYAFEPLTGSVKMHFEPNKEMNKWRTTYGAVSINHGRIYLLDIAGTLRMFKVN